MRKLKSTLRGILNACLEICHSLVLPGFKQELERRNAERGAKGPQWLTAEEKSTFEALSRIVIPSEETAPGIEDIRVLGASAIEALNKIAMDRPDKQELYARGLLAFDTWATNEFGCKFAELSELDQVNLFRSAERTHDDWTAKSSLLRRMRSWIRMFAQSRNGLYYSVALFPHLRNDCLEIFYTSRVSWVWLDYDGPPMDEGYPGLEPRRSNQNNFAQDSAKTR